MPTFKSSSITNADATPYVPDRANDLGAYARSFTEVFELADTADGDDAIVLRFPATAVLKRISMACDDLGSAGTISIGVHRKNADGTYTVVAAAAFASNINVNTAAVALTDYRYNVKNIDTANQPLWQLAGLSAAPSYGDLFLSITTATGTTTAGTVLFDVVAVF
jgi:hypothetical protein